MTNNTLDTICWLLEQTKRAGADTCDAVMFETTDISTSRRMRKPEGLERSESRGIGLRAFVGRQQAIVSATDIHKNSLEELAERAVSMARSAPADPDSTLAAEQLLAKELPELDLYDSDEPSLVWLSEQCEQAEEAALSVIGITNSEGADAHYSKNHISLALHNGKQTHFAQSYSGSHFSVSVSVIAGIGTGMERDYEFTSSRHRRNLEDATSVGVAAAERTLKRLNPRKVPTCQVPVVFDPRISRGLLGVLASAISGSSIARGSSFLKDKLGERIFGENIRIVDNPHIRSALGSKPFDAEGVKNTAHNIIENGVLTTWLLDVRTASKLGLKSTGHATRGIASPPSPSSSNLYMEKGKLTPKELIGEVKNGLYVTETFGMGINTVTGDYSQGAAGFWIENGEITYPVSEITIAGHLLDMFSRAVPANDLVLRYATNAPTIRIDGMTVAGV